MELRKLFCFVIWVAYRYCHRLELDFELFFGEPIFYDVHIITDVLDTDFYGNKMKKERTLLHKNNSISPHE